MRDHSFLFGQTDVREQFGVIVQKVDRPFFAKLRARKTVIPGRSGAYDYGAQYRDELILPIKCGTVSLLGQSDVRELIYALSKKSTITLWDEPDKYYVGRLYDTGKIARIVSTMREFTLSFVCDPFLYGTVVNEHFGIEYVPSYAGSEKTPARIEIRNTGAQSITGIHITVTNRRENF